MILPSLIDFDSDRPKLHNRLLNFSSLGNNRFSKTWTSRLLMAGLTAAICLLPDVSSAQDVKKKKEASKKEVPPGAAAHMSVVALGPIPTRRYKMPDDDDLEDIESEADGESGDDRGDGGDKDEKSRPARDSGGGGIPILLPPLAGAVPPPALFYKLPKVSKGGNPWARMRVGFNNATSVSRVHAGVPLDLHYRDRDRSSGYRSYLKLPALEPWSQVVVFLTPSKDGETPWKNDPHMSVLNLRSQALRDKNVLVRNFSNEAVAFVIDDNAPVTLKSGQRRSFKIERKAGFHRVAAIKLNGKVPVLKTSVRVPANTLNVFAFYNAEPQTNGGKNVGAFRTTLSKLSPTELAKKMTVPKP